ncbi:GNAT family N-acetyltransferase [Paracraurococcus lichenis]|uniref:GNAT family N-acetyltransferase n=1 Tax=Paracraurococcus lichenis TaxID=3064888 RepID=A0ABT9E9Z2_9PROT|nr:GNAT family N-acetyltransferase [Paracraurococcus sp. LOR1-02]MDO9712740.1 GNAT family N-acetyltransferase [Paracraurococcus sp. LOR1-02]
MFVRCACERDAAQASEVTRRSIAELCTAEYRGNPLVLAGWLADKTPADFRRWIGSADRAVCVAVWEDGQIAAVGMVAWRGEILLNFAAPEARFRGVSKALMAHMERHLRDRGVKQVVLFSTHVARRFYGALGYAEVARRESRFGTLDIIEMAKPLG